MKYAGLLVRIMAHNIDLVFLLPIFYLISTFIEYPLYLYISCFVAAYSYEVSFTLYRWNGTPGKRFLHIAVKSKQNSKLATWKIFLRPFIKTISSLTFFIGFLVIALNPSKKSIHDMIIGSIVIFEEKG